MISLRNSGLCIASMLAIIGHMQSAQAEGAGDISALNGECHKLVINGRDITRACGDAVVVHATPAARRVAYIFSTGNGALASIVGTQSGDGSIDLQSLITKAAGDANKPVSAKARGTCTLNLENTMQLDCKGKSGGKALEARFKVMKVLKSQADLR